MNSKKEENIEDKIRKEIRDKKVSFIRVEIIKLKISIEAIQKDLNKIKDDIKLYNEFIESSKQLEEQYSEIPKELEEQFNTGGLGKLLTDIWNYKKQQNANFVKIYNEKINRLNKDKDYLSKKLNELKDYLNEYNRVYNDKYRKDYGEII
ncbi:MAG: hypothetical protein ACFFG0_51055 [Candidatus Thorarchaeota archaeon]